MRYLSVFFLGLAIALAITLAWPLIVGRDGTEHLSESERPWALTSAQLCAMYAEEQYPGFSFKIDFVMHLYETKWHTRLLNTTTNTTYSCTVTWYSETPNPRIPGAYDLYLSD